MLGALVKTGLGIDVGGSIDNIFNILSINIYRRTELTGLLGDDL